VAPSWAKVASSSGASPTVPKKEERGGDFDDDEALEVRAFERLDSMDCMLIASLINDLSQVRAFERLDSMDCMLIASLINDLSQVRAFECTGDLKHTVEAINEGGKQHAILEHTVEAINEGGKQHAILEHTVEAINEGGKQHAILKLTVEESVAGALGTAPRTTSTAQVATAWQAQDSAQDSAKGSAGTVKGRPRTEGVPNLGIEYVPVAPALLWTPLAISLVLLAIMMLRRSSRWRSRSEMRSAAAMRVGGARRRIT
jgi:hypothetical protein